MNRRSTTTRRWNESVSILEVVQSVRASKRSVWGMSLKETKGIIMRELDLSLTVMKIVVIKMNAGLQE